jgi:hypothetical protein
VDRSEVVRRLRICPEVVRKLARVLVPSEFVVRARRTVVHQWGRCSRRSVANIGS